MKPSFLCHPQFQDLSPIHLYHKEHSPYTHPKGLPSNKHYLFRRKAALPPFEKALLRITADDHYKLYINGAFVCEGPAPSYPHAYYYNELDLTPYLHEGENTFAVHTYYQGLINRVWVSGDLRSSFYFDLALDGKTFLVSDNNWRVAEHTAYRSAGITGYDTTFLESYDSRDPICSFAAADYDDSAWLFATPYRHADYNLVKQPTKTLVYESLTPVSTAKTPTSLKLDFGREAVGRLTLTAKGKRGDRIILRFAEELNDDGSPRYRLRCNCHYEEEWILSGDTDKLSPYDTKAFRYAELLFPEGASFGKILFTAQHYPFQKKAVYETENQDLQRILTLCEDTVSYGVGENFVDCPTREKGQYLGDLAVTGRAHATLTGDTAPFKKAILDFCHSSPICKGLLAVSTASFMQEIADYSLQFPALIAWIYAMDGDLDFVKKTLPTVKGVFDYFADYRDENGLLSGVKEKWNLVDWPDSYRDGYAFPLPNPVGDGLHNVLNAFYIGFLAACDELLTLVGEAPTGLTEKTKDAFIKTFYDETTGLFSDTPKKTHTAVHSAVLPLLFEIGTEDAALKERLVEKIAAKGLSSMGVYFAYFALAALVKADRLDLAEGLATDPACWMNMLKEGATTTFEAWGKDKKWNTSLFHPWATAPAIVFAKGVRVY